MSVRAEASRCLRRNDPPINQVHINFNLSGLFPRLELDDEEFDFDYDDFKDVAAWRLLGIAIRNNPTIKELTLGASAIAIEPRDELLELWLFGPRDDSIAHQGEVSAAECYRVFCYELKKHTSIEELTILNIDQVLQIFDLGYFLQNNTNLKYLTLRSGSPLTPEQGNIIASALAGVQLRKLHMGLRFGDGAFEKIVSACSGVERLIVECETNSQFTAVAALLRNPNARLQFLNAEQSTRDDVEIDVDMAVSEISESLVGNTKLRELWLDLNTREVDFDMLLCNSTTLQNICNSNHTLEKVASYSYHIQAIKISTEECLELNRNDNKNKVIQNKVMQFYFVGSFNLAPFASMPLSVLAKVMSGGEEMKNKQTAIFELLRAIPELCNVSSRCVERGQNNRGDKIVFMLAQDDGDRNNTTAPFITQCCSFCILQ
jgi:hypothetical protein